ncbi:MAG: DNA repair protein RecN, partial [Desulfovibrionales bacterium]
GEKLSPDMVRPGTEKASVEALFNLSDGEWIIRRELVAETGRSRVYLNDSLSGQEKVKSMAPSLLIHTSQHAQQRLLKPGFHAQIVDEFLPDPALLEEKAQLVEELRSIEHKMAALRRKGEELAEKREYLQFQKEEIARVDPREDEEDELVRQREQSKHQARAQEAVQASLTLLHTRETGILDSLGALQKSLEEISEADQEFLSSLESLVEAREILEELGRKLHSTGFEQERYDLEAIESRLWKLSQLKRKLNRTLPEILSLQEEIEENLSFLDASNLELSRMQKEFDRGRDKLVLVLDKVNASRKKAASRLKIELEKELHELGFSEHVQVDFEFVPGEIIPGVIEQKPRLLWLPNPGQPPQALDKIASGGELSRFLLAMVGIRGRLDLPALLFDEVDAGIGGMILNTVGERIKRLSGRQQVILITHWPQLARWSDSHFQVSKEVKKGKTFTVCRRLGEEERIQELGRMAGGGEEGLEMARKLTAGN